MTAVNLAPPPILQFLNNAGQPNAGGTVLTQVGGVNYPTYQDSAGSIALPNPIPLNSRGEISNAAGVSSQLFLVSGVTYTFTLYDANNNQINQPISVTAPTSSSVPTAPPEWISGSTPTYVSATQFTVAGDQRTTYDVNRRIKATVTAGTVYGYVSAVAYTTLTTITVVLDSGALDAGLSAVWYGLLDALNPSVPQEFARQDKANLFTAQNTFAKQLIYQIAVLYRVTAIPPSMNGGTALVLDPYGNPVNIAGTTTSGILEAYNFAVANNWNLHLAGQSSNTGTPGNSVYNCTTHIPLQSSHVMSFTSDAITINFTNAVTDYGFKFDSQDAMQLDLKGQIVWNANGGNLLQFTPVSIPPSDANIFITASKFRFGNLVPLLATNGILINSPTNGAVGVTQNLFEWNEMNGGTNGVNLTTPAFGDISGNLFICNGMHGQTTQINASAALLSKNRWISASFNSPVASITVGASPFTFTNLNPAPLLVTVSGGTVSQILMNSGQGGATPGNVFSNGNALFQLAPGNGIQITYSVAPSMWQMTN